MSEPMPSSPAPEPEPEPAPLHSVPAPASPPEPASSPSASSASIPPPPGCVGSSLSVAEHLAAIGAHIDALTAVPVRDLGSADVLHLFDASFLASDRLHALAAQTLPCIEADGLWALDGTRTFPTWVARRAKIGYGTARRMTRLGHALRDELRLTATAVLAGGTDRVGVEHAHILTTLAATSPTRKQVLADPDAPVAEQFLLTQARLLPVDAFRTLARRWAGAADPDADDRGYTAATDREYLEVSPTTGGTHLSGFLTTDHGQTLLTALDAIGGIPAKDDTRTNAARRASALHDLARITLDHTQTGRSTRPHLSVLVDYPTLLTLTGATGCGATTCTTPTLLGTTKTAGAADETDGTTAPAWTGLPGLPLPGLAGTGPRRGPSPPGLSPAVFEDGQPVPRAVLDRILCDCELTRYVFGPHSEILNYGRTKRTYPRKLRRALIARDKHCQYPTCTAPPRLCEGHHSKHWARDHGTTDSHTGILLCWHHHTHVHNNNIEIQWKPTHGWQFTDKHGQPLTM